MYNNLLQNVVKVINTSARLVENDEQQHSDFYNMLFAPELYEEQRRKQLRREQLKNKMIVAATSLAVVGELYHVGKQSGIINKLKR